MLLTIAVSTTNAARLGIFCYMSNDSTYVYADSSMTARLVLTETGEAQVLVENLTDDILYLDRGNSFVYLNGSSQPMFIPSASTRTDGNITTELYHGPAGTAWTTGEAHLSSHTVFNTRILPVAPHGTAVAYAWPKLSELAAFDKALKPGEQHHYTRDNSPLRLAVDLMYGFRDPYLAVGSESDVAGDRCHARLSDYMSAVIGWNYRGVSKNGVIQPKNTPPVDGCRCFAFRQGTAPGGTLTAVLLGAALVTALVALPGDTDVPSMQP